MEIKLTKTEAEGFFFNALCNGLSHIGVYGLALEALEVDYKAARERLKEKDPNGSVCFEDVLMEILRHGGELTMKDLECDGEYTRSITLNEVYDRISQTPAKYLVDMLNENDDAETADVILQTVFYQEIVFG
jgi:hypothetical protein